ncbi:MAG: RpoH suppressor SuhR [Elainellaceae cyanobacterium]
MPQTQPSSASEPSAASYFNPERDCDLVMKGGITSGIVYPPAICKLASEGKYRFRSVGGTSAGAIAAAVTAAAEYGRDKAWDGRPSGFDRLDALSGQLCEEGFLLSLFQPEPELKPLMDALLAILGITPDPNTGRSNRASSDHNPKPKKSWLKRIQELLDITRRTSPASARKGTTWGLIGSGVLALVLGTLAAIAFGIAGWLTGNAVALGDYLLGVGVLAVMFIVLERLLGVGTLAAGAVDLYTALFKMLPANLFGICTGHIPEGSIGPDPDPIALTDWLSVSINNLAGLEKTGRPLTFGDLRKKPLPNGELPDCENGKYNIDLRVVTANLSHNRPYALPFEPDHRFIFNVEEFRRLFPSNVVQHLLDHAGQRPQYDLPDGYYFLPDPDDLPVVLATRMSLSFPVLISAVPLYTVSQSCLNRHQPGDVIQVSDNPDSKDLQQNWFSDGGICSNFPIHFFDSWLPTRPTFGINLGSVSEDALQARPGFGTSDTRTINPDYLSVTPNSPDLQTERSQESSRVLNQDVFLPRPNDRQAPEWVDLQSNLLAFAWQMFQTAQNYRDTSQAGLPGYRERIAQVRLSHDEGGLNLAMSKETIEGVMQKGETAGDKLINEFSFENHQWVRFRVLMGLLEERLTQLEEVAFSTKKFDYEKLTANQANYPYAYPDEKYAKKARECVDRMRQSVTTFWECEPALDEKIPQPKTVLRTTPEL